MRSDTQGLTVLTASPKIIGSSIKRLLKKHNLKNYELIMRPLNEKALEYKISRVNKVYSEKEEASDSCWRRYFQRPRCLF